jgi:cardiolipin synthase
MTGALITAAALLLDFCLRVVIACAILLRPRKPPAVRLAWLAVLFALPIVGLVAYLVFGEPRLGRRRAARHREVVRRLALHDAAAPAVEGDLPAQFRPIAHLAETVGGNHPQGGHGLRLFAEADLFIQALVEDIAAARSHCHLLFYIYLADHSGERVGEALAAAARRGVACRLLVDAVGSKLFLRSALRRRMAQAGVEVAAALPVSVPRMLLARLDLRNHRKIAIVDAAVGYSGSQNVADASFAIKKRFAPWVDCMVRVEGPVVRDLHEIFVEDWSMEGGEVPRSILECRPAPIPGGATVQVAATGPNSYNEGLHRMNQATFHVAREELILTTPYFVPDEATLAAMYTTARRGVEVTLVVPKRNDSPLVAAASRSYYETLLDAGVSVYEYRRGLLHAKTITVDRDFAVVTTANLDRRSFDLNFEVSLLVYDDDFASELRLLQRAYVSRSDPVDADAWTRRPWPARLAQNALGLLSPLL